MKQSYGTSYNTISSAANQQPSGCVSCGGTPSMYPQGGTANMAAPMGVQNFPLFMQDAVMQQQNQTQQPQQPYFQAPAAQNTAPYRNITPIPTSDEMRFTDFEQLSILQDGIPITAESAQFLNGFLRTQIGRRVKVEFLVGTGSFLDKEGILLGVGVNYILINETDTDDITACDFYAIKFIKFYF